MWLPLQPLRCGASRGGVQGGNAPGARSTTTSRDRTAGRANRTAGSRSRTPHALEERRLPEAGAVTPPSSEQAPRSTVVRGPGRPRPPAGPASRSAGRGVGHHRAVAHHPLSGSKSPANTGRGVRSRPSGCCVAVWDGARWSPLRSAGVPRVRPRRGAGRCCCECEHHAVSTRDPQVVRDHRSGERGNRYPLRPWRRTAAPNPVHVSGGGGDSLESPGLRDLHWTVMGRCVPWGVWMPCR